jgi:hypothetical protein
MSIQTLKRDLPNINDLVALQSSDNELHLCRARLDQTLADYYEDIQEETRMKAGMKYKSQGKRPTKYFTALVKQRSKKNNLTALTVKRNGSEVSLHTIEEILGEASDFYADLYSRKVQSDDADSVKVFLNRNVSNCLSDEDRETCDKALTEDELFAALKKLPSGKVPGIDGLPAEFFKEFWDELKLSFFELSQTCFNDGCLPESMRTSIVTLIYKKEARDDIRNYRPISLLCSDYKIIAKAFAERMKMVLPNIIHKD